MDKIRVFIADDHVMLREGLKLILKKDISIEIAGEADDGLEAVDKILKVKPDIVILDISMPKMTGLDTARNLIKFNKDIRIIILTRHDNEEYVKRAMNIGARGYILKDSAGDDLIKAVRDVMKGNFYLSPSILTSLVKTGFPSQLILNTKQRDYSDSLLTNREKEVLKLVAEGRSSNEIASLLRISPKTVKVHRLNLMNKLDLHNVTELVKYAIKNGLIDV